MVYPPKKQCFVSEKQLGKVGAPTALLTVASLDIAGPVFIGGKPTVDAT